MTRQEAIEDLIILFCGHSPRIQVERLSDLDEAAYEQMQSFLASYTKLPWLTGIGMLEAIDSLVDEAIANSIDAFTAFKKV